MEQKHSSLCECSPVSCGCTWSVKVPKNQKDNRNGALLKQNYN